MREFARVYRPASPIGADYRLPARHVSPPPQVRVYVLNKLDVLRRLDRRTLSRIAAAAELASWDNFADDSTALSEFVQAETWARFKRALVIDIIGSKRRERRGAGGR